MVRNIIAKDQTYNNKARMTTRATCYEEEGCSYEPPFYTVDVEQWFDGCEYSGRFSTFEFDDKQKALDYMNERLGR